MVSWESLVRFIATDGNVYWAPLALNQEPANGLEVDGYADIDAIEGDAQSKKVTIQKLLAPAPNPNLPIVCIGLNYGNHAAEASLPEPAMPPMWFKASTCLAHPGDDIPVPKQAQKGFPDYEGELTVILRSTIKDVPKSCANNHILGYTIGNDLTARAYQRACGVQYTYAKNFDHFAPLGPRLVHPSVFNPDPSAPDALRMTTAVNGRVWQDSAFDLIFGIPELIEFLSQGQTLQKGTAIMTGTPAGVGWWAKPEKRELKDGDVVEIEIDRIGKLRNKMVFV